MSLLNEIKSKILIDYKDKIKDIKRSNKKIVFTNGCFDILHLGHIEYLSKSKDLGDVLVVAVNTDNSPYFKTKGDGRPINNEITRSTILASLYFVDVVILFSDETPLKLIEDIRPDVLVKGKDYKECDIVGYDIVKSYNGQIITISITEGYSTTNIIDKIIKLNC
jgi:rfaE bifunctional protein nucleotidyltransferase chain/domain